MKVSDLRAALADMPGEMPVYAVGGEGIASAQHTFRRNLLPDSDGDSFDQFCELRTYFQDHTPQGEDTRIERETGFKNRDELIAAYIALKASQTLPASDGEGGSGLSPRADQNHNENNTPTPPQEAGDRR